MDPRLKDGRRNALSGKERSTADRAELLLAVCLTAFLVIAALLAAPR
jgi:hypothetical protein